MGRESNKQKIINVLLENSILDNTRMVLVNAIYFKGDWNNKFDEKTLMKENSILITQPKNTQMMYQKRIQLLRR